MADCTTQIDSQAMHRLDQFIIGVAVYLAIITKYVSSNPPQIGPLKIPDLLEEGQRLAIMCAVMKGSQPISFSWRKDNVPIVLDDNIKIAHNDDYQETLQIIKLLPEHVGNYSCSAKNLHGSSQVSVGVLLRFAPKWISYTTARTNDAVLVEAIAGNSVTIDCRSYGYPTPKITVHRGKCHVFLY